MFHEHLEKLFGTTSSRGGLGLRFSNRCRFRPAAIEICCQKPRISGSEKGVFWKRGLFRKAHFLENLENLENLEILEILEILENSPDCGKQRRIRPFSRDCREFRDFRDSRDFSGEKTPFVMTPFSGPENIIPAWESRFQCRLELRVRLRRNSRARTAAAGGRPPLSP